MISSPVEEELEVAPIRVRVTADTLTVDLEDGRTISVPTAWYPRLASGTRKEWANYEVGALGIHWPDLDEDLSIRGLLLGRKSGESAASLQFWLDARQNGKSVTLADFVKSLQKRAVAKGKRKAV
jgi:hypothetical protein